MLTLPSSRVFAVRLPFGNNSPGFGIAINYLSVFGVFAGHGDGRPLAPVNCRGLMVSLWFGDEAPNQRGPTCLAL